MKVTPFVDSFNKTLHITYVSNTAAGTRAIQMHQRGPCLCGMHREKGKTYLENIKR